MRTLIERKENIVERITSLEGHIVNMHKIGGEGRLMLASQFEEKVQILKQRLFEINYALGL